MTFTEIVTRITNRLNQTSATATTRIGQAVNDVYKSVTTSVGLGTSRRTEVQATAGIGSQFITFTGIEKVISVIDRSTGSARYLNEVTIDELDRLSVSDSDIPTAYAIYRANAGSVQIKTNANAQTAYTLYAPGYIQATTLSGTQEPAFPESFHDLLVSGVLYEEYMKLEKPGLAKLEEAKYTDRLGDLRLFLQTSPQQDIYRSKLAGSTTHTGSAAGGGVSGGGSDGSTSYTQTGLITFDRTGAVDMAPFAVAAGSTVVANLIAASTAFATTAGDADTLDGQHGAYYQSAANLNAGTIPDARFPATLPAASGVNLTNVNAATLGGSSAAALQLAILQAVMPIGFVVTLGVATNPATLYGFGTWAAIAGRVIVGRDAGQTEFDTLDETGGAKTHTLTSGEMPSHTHTQNAHTHVQTRTTAAGGASTDFSIEATRNTTYASSASSTQSTTATNQNTGGDGAHNNLQPYIVKYVWQRTA